MPAGYQNHIQSSNMYYPYGSLQPGRYSQTAVTSRYSFQGQEKYNEIRGEGNHNTALFWEYDTRLGRRWNIDPVDKPNESSYLTFSGNPVLLVDPNGDNANPIYDDSGEFLGTDDKGLQGEAIVMNKDDFTQGMAHDEALKKGLLLSDFSKRISSTVGYKITQHQTGLKNRPDWDGFVTIEEGVQWAKEHPNALDRNDPNESLYLDASKLDFGNLSMSSLKNNGGNKKSFVNINVFTYTAWALSDSRATSYALGNTRIKIVNENDLTIKLDYDLYDWDYHSYSVERRINKAPPKSLRDKLIHIERRNKGLNDSHGFRVEIYGIGTLRR